MEQGYPGIDYVKARACTGRRLNIPGSRLRWSPALFMFPVITLLHLACSPGENGDDGALPNIVIIYADDIGYGDVSAYGMTNVLTPNIDRIADEGLLFRNAHSAAATCTPSRFALLTGCYPWRKKGTAVAPGDASMIIEAGRETAASVLQRAGYETGVVGKWHLGLGGEDGPDWNGEIDPGPDDIGFDYSFLIPATGDRVPCVYVENNRVVGLDADDPIEVSYNEPIGDEPTGRDNPELLKMKHSHGHDNTIVNGIGRIGYMTGGTSARWVDEDMADVITGKAVEFIENQKGNPFFLYFSTHDIHVPRVPHSRFAGQSGMGPRGDVILQLDFCVGVILSTLDRLGLSDNTLVIFSSDNGPVVDDGYQDDAVTKLNGHTPAGDLRGGKYSAFEAGTRVPFIVRWPDRVESGVSDALVGQIDLIATVASLVDEDYDPASAPDSQNQLLAWLGKDTEGRDQLIASASTLSLIKGNWKYIAPSNGQRVSRNTNIETGNDTVPQLYDLSKDIGEVHNVAREYPAVADSLRALLEQR